LDEYSPSGLYIDNIQRPVSQHDLSYHSQSIINELRAGDSRVTQAALVVNHNLDVAETTKRRLSASKTSYNATTFGISTEFTFWKTEA
jgi:hypothetical protein